ncbi:MAG TPA: hypothetical protein PLJ71_08065 [Candidatus Hydrogenedentes bacterium]|nr:hypothetical protein [Candidatus Hydrogenedentota bacterium]
MMSLRPLSRLVPACALSVVLVVLVALPAFAAAEKEDFSAKPWDLREHYIFSFDQANARFLYGSDNAEWSIEFEGIGTFIDKARASITFADGAETRLVDFDKGEADREHFDTPMGSGNHFCADLPERNGIKVRHMVSVHNEYPFLIIRMEVTNTGQAPIEIAKMSPAIFGPDCIKNVSGQMQAAIRRIDMRAGYAVFDRGAKSSLALFHDPAKEKTIGLGVLPLNIARSGINLEPYGGSWQGDIASVFEPPVKLEPGKSLSADPVFVTFSVPKPEEVETYFTWTRSNLPRPSTQPDAPRCWCTVEEDSGADALYAAAAKWAEAGVRYALVPAAWESRPGSLEGARPRYPKTMQTVAAALGAMEMAPGITVEPLAATKGGEAFSAAMAGQTWLNLSHPEGRAQAVANMRQVAGWGFKFFVVQKSPIPDEVLRAFNMTRAQADALAHEVVAEAAGDLPVFPSSATALKDGLEDWLEAAGCTSRLWEYQIAAGPVRFDTSGVRSLSPDVCTVMAFFGGPIELLGLPHRELVPQIAAIKHQVAQPVDIMQRSPRTWLVAGDEAGKGERTQVTFPKSSS